MKKLSLLILSLLVITGFVFAQSITVTSPNGNENWKKNSSHPVTWTSSGITGNVIIQLMQGGASQGAIYNGANTGSFSWTINNYLNANPITSGAYKLQVKSLNDTSIKDQSDATFTIGKPGPQPVCSLNITSPCAPGSSVTLWGNTSKNIIWDPSLSPGGNVRINMTYTNCPGESGPVLLILYTLAFSTPNDGNFAWTTPDVKGVKCYKITIRKIGTSCSGRSGVFKVRPRLLVFRKVLSPAAVKLKYKKYITPLAKMIVKLEPMEKIKLKMEAFMKEYFSKNEGSGHKAREAALKAIQAQVEEEIAESLIDEAKDAAQRAKEQWKAALKLIKEMMERKSENVKNMSRI